MYAPSVNQDVGGLVKTAASGGNATIPPFAQNSQGGASPAAFISPPEAMVEWFTNYDGNNNSILMLMLGIVVSKIFLPVSTTDIDFSNSATHGLFAALESAGAGNSFGYDFTQNVNFTQATVDGFLAMVAAVQISAGTIVLPFAPTGGMSNAAYLTLTLAGWTVTW
jgi:hypothetical protein